MPARHYMDRPESGTGPSPNGVEEIAADAVLGLFQQCKANNCRGLGPRRECRKTELVGGLVGGRQAITQIMAEPPKTLKALARAL